MNYENYFKFEYKKFISNLYKYVIVIDLDFYINSDAIITKKLNSIKNSVVEFLNHDYVYLVIKTNKDLDSSSVELPKDVTNKNNLSQQKDFLISLIRNSKNINNLVIVNNNCFFYYVLGLINGYFTGIKGKNDKEYKYLKFNIFLFTYGNKLNDNDMLNFTDIKKINNLEDCIIKNNLIYDKIYQADIDFIEINLKFLKQYLLENQSNYKIYGITDINVNKPNKLKDIIDKNNNKEINKELTVKNDKNLINKNILFKINFNIPEIDNIANILNNNIINKLKISLNNIPYNVSSYCYIRKIIETIKLKSIISTILCNTNKDLLNTIYLKFKQLNTVLHKLENEEIIKELLIINITNSFLINLIDKNRDSNLFNLMNSINKELSNSQNQFIVFILITTLTNMLHLKNIYFKMEISCLAKNNVFSDISYLKTFKLVDFYLIINYISLFFSDINFNNNGSIKEINLLSLFSYDSNYNNSNNIIKFSNLIESDNINSYCAYISNSNYIANFVKKLILKVIDSFNVLCLNLLPNNVRKLKSYIYNKISKNELLYIQNSIISFENNINKNSEFSYSSNYQINKLLINIIVEGIIMEFINLNLLYFDESTNLNGNDKFNLYKYNNSTKSLKYNIIIIQEYKKKYINN